LELKLIILNKTGYVSTDLELVKEIVKNTRQVIIFYWFKIQDQQQKIKFRLIPTSFRYLLSYKRGNRRNT
jgi:hypothetical protein